MRNRTEKRITIAGAGMGALSGMTERTRALLEQADTVIGASRLLEGIKGLYDGRERRPGLWAEYRPQQIAEQLGRMEPGNTVVLMSGDSGFYSGTRKLLSALEAVGLSAEVEPGISALSYFASRLRMSWEEIHIVSLHGCRANLAAALRKHERVFALTQGQNEEICHKLTAAGFGEIRLYVGRRLSYPDEEIVETTPAAYRGTGGDGLSVLLLCRPAKDREPLTGIPDEAFLRGEVPMTKSELRAVILSKLRIRETDIVYDIGAGTGSVSVELSMAAERGRVYAVECKEEAAELTERNRERFGCDNIEVIRGMAPEALEGLPPADAVFIGGSRGRLLPVLKQVLLQGKPVRILISAVTLETVSEALEDFRELGICLVDACQIGVTRLEPVGHYHMLKAQNPVFLVTGSYPGAEGDSGRE